jgi:hypothetical protein
MKAQRLEEKNKNNNVPGKKFLLQPPQKKPRFISFAGARESPWYEIYKKKITSVNYVKLCQQQQNQKAT